MVNMLRLPVRTSRLTIFVFLLINIVMTEMKVIFFDNTPKHYHNNPEKLFNQTFLVWFGVLIRKCWSKCTGKLQNTVPSKWFFFSNKIFIYFLYPFKRIL